MQKPVSTRRETDLIAPETTSFLGIDHANLSLSETLEYLHLMAKNDRFSYLVTPNVDHLVNLYPTEEKSNTRSFSAAYKAANLVICDSRILAMLGRLSGKRLSVVPGSDLTARLFEKSLRANDRIAIIGGDKPLLQKLSARYPDPDYFQHIPPMGVLNNRQAQADILQFIAQTKADYVLFAIGSPQSEILAHQCQKSGDCRGVGLCIGASLEFITAAKKRAPAWMQRTGLEWLFRLLSEPSRLWRRYLVDGPRIFSIYWRLR